MEKKANVIFLNWQLFYTKYPPLDPSKPIMLFPFKTLLTWAGDLRELEVS
jgi:hypothetical protein